MFDVLCPAHGRRVLLFPANIRALVNHPHGIELRWRCFCGQEGATWFPRPELPPVGGKPSR